MDFKIVLESARSKFNDAKIDFELGRKDAALESLKRVNEILGSMEASQNELETLVKDFKNEVKAWVMKLSR